jgi:hypothetical protein
MPTINTCVAFIEKCGGAYVFQDIGLVNCNITVLRNLEDKLLRSTLTSVLALPMVAGVIQVLGLEEVRDCMDIMTTGHEHLRPIFDLI